MLKRIIIISSWGLCSFAFGRWFSSSAQPRAAGHASVRSTASVATIEKIALPPPERAAGMPFLDLYHSLKASSAKERAAYHRSLEMLPKGPGRREAMVAFFQCMARISPQAAVDLLLTVNKEDIQCAAAAVLGGAPASATPLLVKMLLDLPPEVDPKWRETAVRGQMFFWAALDVSAAAQFAEQYQKVYPNLAAGGIVQCMAATDPEMATRWMKDHPEASRDPALLDGYVHGLFQNDPARAWQYLNEHCSEEAVTPLLKPVANFTFLQAADEAANFIKNLPTKEARRVALDGVVFIDPEAFATPETSAASLNQGVAEWITKFPPDEWPPAAMPYLLNRWREIDSKGAIAWMAQLPTPNRTAVVRQLAEKISPDNLKELLTVTAGDLHQDLLAAYARGLPTTPEQRKAYIEALDLAPADAAQLSLRQQ